MKRKLRKPLSWLLTVAMIFSLFCGMIPTASAVDSEGITDITGDGVYGGRGNVEFRLYTTDAYKLLKLADPTITADTTINSVTLLLEEEYLGSNRFTLTGGLGTKIPTNRFTNSIANTNDKANPSNITGIEITYDGEKTVTIQASDLRLESDIVTTPGVEWNAVYEIKSSNDEKCVVAFYDNGETDAGAIAGYELYAVRIVNSGSTVGKDDFPPAPEHISYSFVSWNDKPDGEGTPFDYDTVVTSDMNIYARNVSGLDVHTGTVIHVMNEDNALLNRYIELYNEDPNNEDISLADFTQDVMDSMKVTIHGEGTEATNPDYWLSGLEGQHNGWIDDDYFLVLNYNAELLPEGHYHNTHIPATEISGITVEATIDGQTVSVYISQGSEEGQISVSPTDIATEWRLVLNGSSSSSEGNDINQFEKNLVTSEPTGITLPSDTVVKYPAENETVEVPVNGSVTLMYQFTVEGKADTQFTIADEGATAVGGNYTSTTDGTIIGTIPEGGTATIYAIKTFDVDDLDPVEGDTYALNNKATIFIVGEGSIADDENEATETVPADEGAPVPPSEDELEDLFGEDTAGAVTIDCTTAEVGFNHEPVTYGLLDGGYVSGDSVDGTGTTEDPWTYTITVTPSTYVSQYALDQERDHALAPNTQSDQEIKLVWKDGAWTVASEVPVKYTVSCSDGLLNINAIEFHIMDLDSIKAAVEEKTNIDAEDIGIYAIHVNGDNYYANNTPTTATGGFSGRSIYEQFLLFFWRDRDPDKGVLANGYDTYQGIDFWRVYNTFGVVNDDEVTSITIYYKNEETGETGTIDIPRNEFAKVVHLDDLTKGHITEIYLDTTSDEPEEPGDEKPLPPTDSEITGPNGILAGAIRLDCSTNGHDAVTCDVAANTVGRNNSFFIGEVEGNAVDGYTCDITVYPVESYLKDYNTTYPNTYSGHTYAPDSQSDTITLVWNPTGGQDGKGAWTVKDGKYALFAVKCSPVENAPEPTYDQLKGLIGVQVVCDNQNHGEKTYELIQNSYSVTVTGNTAVVTVGSNQYVALYNNPNTGIAPGHSTVADQTITLTWNNEKGWIHENGNYTVTFNVNCDNSEKYIITAAAGENGSIAPEGQVPVKAGAQQDFTFTPDDGYAVDTVYVSNNGENKTFVNNGTKQLLSWEGYSFPKVTSDGYITVTFAEDHDGDGIPDKYEYTLTYDANGGYFGENKDQSLKQQPVTAGEYELTEKPTHAAVSLENKGAVNVEFVGWTLKKEAAQAKIYQAGDTTVPTTISSVEVKDGDVTVFAVWGYDEDGDGTADVNELVITPADIAIYTGGSGYAAGDVVDEGGNPVDDGANPDASSGFPVPGFYITLPTNLNEALQEATGQSTVNLSNRLYFAYADGTETKGWNLTLYNPNSTSMAYAKYVYHMEPNTPGQDPVRLLIQDENGMAVPNDQFTIALDELFKEYTMSIYAGAVNQNKVTASLKIDDNRTETVGIFVDTGKLTVRGVTDEKTISPIQPNVNTAVSEITAVGSENTYFTNDSDIPVTEQNAVQLLVDPIVNDAGTNEILKKEIEDQLGFNLTSNYELDFQYLDLVDTSNGNAYVTMKENSGDALTIHWPKPDDGENFYVVHFDGLDRDFSNLSEELEKGDTEIEVYKQGKGLTTDEYGNLVFTTSTFSPFALVYETKDPGTGPDTDPDDDKDDDDHYTGGGGNDNDSDPTGNLSIELDVNGGDDEFTFTVYFTDEDGDDLRNNFYYNGDYTGTIGSGDEITLEGGDKIVIRNLPEGTRYEVIIETADGYTYVIDGEEGIIRTGTNEAEFTATRTVPLADPSVTGVSRWLNVTDHIAYLTGYPGGAFGPDNSMTRAEVAQMFYALLNNKNVTITKTFPDVPANAWYATAVNTLASLGMVSGDANGNYRPNDPITRAEFCVIALAFAYEPDNAVCYFSDVSRSDWFYTYVAQAASYGWIGGYTNGNFGPNDRITRAQVTTIVNNMLGRAADRDYVIDHQADLVQFSDLTRAHWGYFQIMEATNAHDYTKSNGTENWR